MKKSSAKDIHRRHVRVYAEVFNSPAFVALSAGAVKLYFDLRTKLGPTNNGNINATLGELKHRGWRSSSTLSRCLKELQAVGLIDKTRQGGIAIGSKVCSLYRFTDEGVYEHPNLGIQKQSPTHDYRRFTALADARAAIREELCASKEAGTGRQRANRAKTAKISVLTDSAKNKVGLRNAKRIDSKSEAEQGNCDSKSGQVDDALVQILKQNGIPI